MSRLFSKEHVWVLTQGNIATTAAATTTENTAVKLGITDYAQKKLKSVMFLNLPDIGDELKIGEKFGDIESIKTVSDLISPVAGKVTAINEELMDDPSVINTSPYESWFIEIATTQLADDIMNEDAYSCMISQL